MNVTIHQLRQRLAQRFDIALADVEKHIPDFQLANETDDREADILEVYRVHYQGKDYYIDVEQHVFTATHVWRDGLLGCPLVKNEA